MTCSMAGVNLTSIHAPPLQFRQNQRGSRPTLHCLPKCDFLFLQVCDIVQRLLSLKKIVPDRDLSAIFAALPNPCFEDCKVISGRQQLVDNLRVVVVWHLTVPFLPVQ